MKRNERFKGVSPSSKRLRKVSGWLYAAILTATLGVVNTTGIFSDPGFDGVARATTATSVPTYQPPRLKLTPSQKLVQGKILNAVELTPITIQVKGIDPADPSGTLYPQYLELSIPEPLPTGASFTSNYGTGEFTWDPQLGDALQYPLQRLTFKVTNTFTLLSRKQVVKILLMDNVAPNFDASLPATLSFTPQKRQKFSVIAIPGSPRHKLKIYLQPGDTLPRGVKLGPTKKGKDGRWSRILTWKPAVTQAGQSFPLTFLAENTDVSVPEQVPYDVVLSVAAP